jgi:prepilin-type processing-associated H-X9-DG protein
VFAQAREKARQTSCLSNMKQIGTAIMMYVQDYDEMTPVNRVAGAPPRRTASVGTAPCEAGVPYASWHDLLQPYIKNFRVMVCPSALTTGDGYSPNNGAQAPFSNDPETLRWSYNSNYIFQRGTCLPGCADNRNNANWPWTPICANGRSMASISEPADLIAVIEGRATSPDVRNAIGNLKCRHNRGSTYIFADGHAAWKRFAATIRPKFLWIDTGLASVAQVNAQANEYERRLSIGDGTLIDCR